MSYLGGSSQRNVSSPFLKGGRALSQKMHSSVLDHKKDEYELVRAVGERCTNHVLGLQTYGQAPEQESVNLKDNERKLKEVELTLEEHEQKLAQYTEQALSMRQESVDNKQHIDRLTSTVNSHQALIDSALRQTHQALEQQRTLLATQYTIIESIRCERCPGWLSESAYVSLALYIVNLPTVSNTLNWLVCKTHHRRRYRFWLLWLLRVLAMVQIIKTTRILDRRFRVSQGLSSLWTSGLDHIVSTLTNLSILPSRKT